MQSRMMDPLHRFAFAARLGLTCLGHGPAALTKVEAVLATDDPELFDDNADPVGFALTAPGPATSLLLAIWGMRQGGAVHAVMAVMGYLTPSVILVVGVLGLLRSGAILLPEWFGGFTQGLTVAAVILFGQMLIQRAPQMVSGSLPAALALLAAAMVWLLPDATGQILALGGCALIALVLNVSPPENVSFERKSVFASSGTGWVAGSVLAAVAILPWLFADSPPGWVASMIRASFLILQNETLLLAALKADLNLEPEFLTAAYGLVAGSGAPMAILAAAAGFGSGSTLWSGLALSLLALGLIHGSSWFSIVFLWPRWQVWRLKNGRASVQAGLQAAAFGILAPVLINPLLITALSGFTAIVLLAAGVFAVLRLNCPPWLLISGLGLISAMAAAL